MSSARLAPGSGAAKTLRLRRSTAFGRFCVDPRRALDAPWMPTVAAAYAGRTRRRSGCRHGAEEGGGHLSAEAGAREQSWDGRGFPTLTGEGCGSARPGPLASLECGWLMSGRTCMTAQQPAALCSGRPAPTACLCGPHPRTHALLCLWQGGVRVQGEEGDERQQVPRYLGQGHQGAWQQRCRPVQLQEEPAGERDRGPVPSDAVPVAHLRTVPVF